MHYGANRKSQVSLDNRIPYNPSLKADGLGEAGHDT